MYKGNEGQRTAQQRQAEQRTTATAADSHSTRHKHQHQPDTRRQGWAGARPTTRVTHPRTTKEGRVVQRSCT